MQNPGSKQSERNDQYARCKVWIKLSSLLDLNTDVITRESTGKIEQKSFGE